MTKRISRAMTLLSLGPRSVARVAAYRLGLKLGVHPVLAVKGVTADGPFFAEPEVVPCGARPPPRSRDVRMFSRWPVTLDFAGVDWTVNPLTGSRFKGPLRSWWKYPDFDSGVGDIKGIWELSRLDWILPLAQRARLGEPGALADLNKGLASWTDGNPAYLGPNWKCGQEASLRILHLAAASLVLGQHRSLEPGLAALIETHLRRIGPTVGYALGQNNNHATSEAAALYIGGSWLVDRGIHGASQWFRTGRKMLETTVEHLIGEQGSFSQHSVNYHRVMLDSLCMVETWRRQLGLPALSQRWYRKLGLAASWLHALTDDRSGETPNIGPNDGARLLVLADCEYRDFRPTVQWSSALFRDVRAYATNGHWDHTLQWLGLSLPRESSQSSETLLADDGGFAILRKAGAIAVLRYPRYRFRPTECDALHVDLIQDGIPLLVDSGTYSYAAPLTLIDQIAGTAGHNTIQFGQREQMPRLGRFLLGEWLRTDATPTLSVNKGRLSVAAAYCGGANERHDRRITLGEDHLEIQDRFDGGGLTPRIRWRLGTAGWHLTGAGTGNAGQVRFENSAGHALILESDEGPLHCELGAGIQSRHYLEKTAISTIEVSARIVGGLRTIYQW